MMRPRDGSDLGENISDEGPTVCQVPGSALDSQLMEGIFRPELLALGAPSDCMPMEGVSCIEPVKQSILRSSQKERSQIGDSLVKGISDKEPTICQVPGSALVSQLMEGISQLEAASCLEPVDQSILLSSWTVSPCNCAIEQKSELEPVITPAVSYYLDSRPMEWMTYLEHSAPGVFLESWPVEGLYTRNQRYDVLPWQHHLAPEIVREIEPPLNHCIPQRHNLEIH